MTELKVGAYVRSLYSGRIGEVVRVCERTCRVQWLTRGRGGKFSPIPGVVSRDEIECVSPLALLAEQAE